MGSLLVSHYTQASTAEYGKHSCFLGLAGIGIGDANIFVHMVSCGLFACIDHQTRRDTVHFYPSWCSPFVLVKAHSMSLLPRLLLLQLLQYLLLHPASPCFVNTENARVPLNKLCKQRSPLRDGFPRLSVDRYPQEFRWYLTSLLNIQCKLSVAGSANMSTWTNATFSGARR